MAFLETRLDAKITQGVTFTEAVPGRTIARLPNGRLYQNFTAAMPLTSCDLSHGVRTAAEYQAVLDAWYIVSFTPYEGLRVKNWRDFQATAANTTLTFITGSTWQLQRLHSFGGIQFKRDIKKPCASPSIVITRNRSGSFTTASATVDTTTGIATISGHVGGDTYTWAGEFDIPMTFTANEWSASLDGGGGAVYAVSGTIQMEEIRL
jgi:uncharacterized protein (TIGR02217 family)